MARYLPIYGYNVPQDIFAMAVALGMGYQKTYRRAGVECYKVEINHMSFNKKTDELWERLVFYGRAHRTTKGYQVTSLGMDEVGKYFDVMIIKPDWRRKGA